MAAQVGIAGGAQIGDAVILAGQVGVGNKVKVGDRVIDGKTLEESNYTFDDILLKENNLQNKIYFKNLLNEVIKSYAG